MLSHVLVSDRSGIIGRTLDGPDLVQLVATPEGVHLGVHAVSAKNGTS
jgi:hypothetical protein